MGPKFKGIAQAKPVSPAAAKAQARLNEAVALHQPDLLPVIYDAAPSKQGKFMLGSHIPIEHPDELMNRPPDYVIVLPWNLGKEILNQLSEIKKKILDSYHSFWKLNIYKCDFLPHSS